MKKNLLLFATFFAIFSGSSQCETFHAVITSIPPTCFEFEDGSLTAYPVGGASPYSMDVYDSGGFLLTPFGGATVEDLSAGTYYVHSEDNIGCYTIDTVLILDPVPLSADYTTTDPTANDICDGSILIDTVYGDYDYLTYYWAPNPSGSTDSLLDGACYGTYILVITNENGCFVNYYIDLALYLSMDEIQSNELFRFTTVSKGRILVQNETHENAELICYDVSGKVILNANLKDGANYLEIPHENNVFIYQIIQNGVIVSSGKIAN